jgi:hypothetical protein
MRRSGAEADVTDLRVWTNDVDTVVARDLADVQVVVEAQYGSTFEQEGWSLDDWAQVPDDESITVRNVHDRGWDDTETHTAREWAARNGRGLLCSTEW